MLKQTNLIKKTIMVTGGLLLSVLLSPCLISNAASVSSSEEVSLNTIALNSYDEYSLDALSDSERLSLGLDASGNVTTSELYYKQFSMNTDNFVLASDLSDDVVYEVNLTFGIDITSNAPSESTIRSAVVYYRNSILLVGTSIDANYSNSLNRTFYYKGSQLKESTFIGFRGGLVSPSAGTYSLSVDYDIQLDSIIPCSASDSEEYEAGYDAGYAAGESNGYSNGYLEGVESVDTDSYYDSGFQAGVDSVDTESYYDAGYEAGYAASYQDGYDDGYAAGFAAASNSDDVTLALLDTVTGSIDVENYIDIGVNDNITMPFTSFHPFRLNVNLDPNKNYCLRIRFTLADSFNTNENNSDSSTGSLDRCACYMSISPDKFNISGKEFPIASINGSYNNFFFSGVTGTTLSTLFDCTFYGYWESNGAYSGFLKSLVSIYQFNYEIKLYETNFVSSDKQIQNTLIKNNLELTDGYDDGSGSSMNDSFSSGVNDYQVAEDSLFVSAKTGLNDFEFYDLESVPAMITGISFVGSVMTSMYDQAGGVSGVGIVLSILFSVMIAAMALGLYRWYQSRGGKK